MPSSKTTRLSVRVVKLFKKKSTHLIHHIVVKGIMNDFIAGDKLPPPLNNDFTINDITIDLRKDL
jgi:hypothetical protein